MVLDMKLFYSSSTLLGCLILALLVSLYPQVGQCQLHNSFFHPSPGFHRGHGFVRARGTRFMVNRKPLYLNGFNAYWLMSMASEPSSDKGKVMMVLLTKYKPSQSSPGSYNEDTFKGLDFVISEAKRNGIYLILSLVNNYDDYGGRKQYVQWARDKGQYLQSDDDFYTNPLTKDFYKNHVKAVLTRINSITGVAYKDYPAIFAWELINEPRCQSDLSGKTLQKEGYYGELVPERKQYNSGYQVGTDFISNNQIPEIDFFTTIHLYPDQWLPASGEQTQLQFVKKWVQSHTHDSNSASIRKPMLLAEFGKSSRAGNNVGQRDAYFRRLYNTIYACARSGGPCGGIHSYGDGYEVVLAECPSTAALITQQSRKLATIK
ncbi:hypothetical protein MKX01_010074 [Papaver californicum]|nr:hypothetical protein MKX01_010074 [Papaver californicum]